MPSAPVWALQPCCCPGEGSSAQRLLASALQQPQGSGCGWCWGPGASAGEYRAPGLNGGLLPSSAGDGARGGSRGTLSVPKDPTAAGFGPQSCWKGGKHVCCTTGLGQHPGKFWQRNVAPRLALQHPPGSRDLEGIHELLAGSRRELGLAWWGLVHPSSGLCPRTEQEGH